MKTKALNAYLAVLTMTCYRWNSILPNQTVHSMWTKIHVCNVHSNIILGMLGLLYEKTPQHYWHHNHTPYIRQVNHGIIYFANTFISYKTAGSAVIF